MSRSLVKEICLQIADSVAVKQSLLQDASLIVQLESLTLVCLQTLRAGGKIIFAGNGGSFADAQHLSAEFTSRFMFDRQPLASIALGTNNSAISAIGNDYGYEQVFARELKGNGKAGDVFIAITTSGNSPNILAAVSVAQTMGIKAYGLTGKTGGQLKMLCDCLSVPSDETARIQECHILMGHILCGLVEAEFYQSSTNND